MIEETYVNIETARLLKEMGFNEKCKKYYLEDEQMFSHEYCEVLKGDILCWNAPTQQIACRWIREVHHLCIEPYRTACGYLFTVSRIPTGSEIYSAEYCGDDEASGQFTTFEGCVEYAIRYVLENLV